jgi:hypothetical protein
MVSGERLIVRLSASVEDDCNYGAAEPGSKQVFTTTKEKRHEEVEG